MLESIQPHLEFLTETAISNNVRTALECGTENGHSTLALLKGIRKTGGCLESIDINPCHTAVQRVYDERLTQFWNFTKGDSRQHKCLFESLDLLFLDTEHNENQVFAELMQFGHLVKSGGIILVHDVLIFPNTFNGIAKYLWDVMKDKEDTYGHNLHWDLNIRTCGCGMLVLRKP